MNTHTYIGQLISKRAYLHPDKLAVNDSLAGRRYSYLELITRVNRVFGVLNSLGLAKGGRVALLTYNSHKFLKVFLLLPKQGWWRYLLTGTSRQEKFPTF